MASIINDIYELIPSSLHKVEDKKLFYSIKLGTKRNNTTYFPLRGFRVWYYFSNEYELCDNWEDRGYNAYLSIMEPLLYSSPIRLNDYSITKDKKLLLSTKSKMEE